MTWELSGHPCELSAYAEAVTQRVGAYGRLLQDTGDEFYGLFATSPYSHPVFGRILAASGAGRAITVEDPGVLESMLEGIARGAPMVGAIEAIGLRSGFFLRVLPFQLGVRAALEGIKDCRRLPAAQVTSRIKRGFDEGLRRAERIVVRQRGQGGNQ